MPTLFSDDSEVLLPGSENNGSESYKNLLTNGVEEAITKKEIKPVLVDSAADIECPSYLLDMTNVESITQHSLTAIKSLLTGGNTAVYLKHGTNIMKIGYGDAYLLYTVLYGVIKEMYNGQCELYRNKGRGFEPMKETEVDMVRLNL